MFQGSPLTVRKPCVYDEYQELAVNHYTNISYIFIHGVSSEPYNTT